MADFPLLAIPAIILLLGSCASILMATYHMAKLILNIRAERRLSVNLFFPLMFLPQYLYAPGPRHRNLFCLYMALGLAGIGVLELITPAKS